VIENVWVTYRDNRWHLVDPQLYRDGVDTEGNRFLLISTYPLSGDMTTWRASVLEVVDIAREYWVKMSRSGNRYEAQIIDDIDFEPCWYKLPIDEFLLDAFGDNVITAENWPAPIPAYKQGLRNGRNRYGFVQEDF
jgi:hypothetical protein